MDGNSISQSDQQFDLPDSGPKHLGCLRKVGSAEISYQTTRSILTRTSGFLDKYDYSLNPYSGCSFGCTYCYAAFFATTQEERDNWGHWVKVKENAVQILRRCRPGHLDGSRIYMSSVTDPYQPIERKLKLTRRLLQTLSDRHKPKLVVQTRSPDVVRDIELFHRITEQGGQVQVNMTVTTDDEEVRQTFEPFCPSNQRRLDAIAAVAQNSIPTCITMTPLLWVNDPERFADALIKTGVEHFVVQDFHLTKGHFVAGTREVARQKMAEKLGCNVASFPSKYHEHYEQVHEVLKSRLSKHGSLGEGKDGFAPPF